MTRFWDIASIGLIPLIGLSMYAVLISLLQEKLIYMPRRYDGPHSSYYKSKSTEASRVLFSFGSSKMISLEYELSDGTEQTAYFLPPTALRATTLTKKRNRRRRGEAAERKAARSSGGEQSNDDKEEKEEEVRFLILDDIIIFPYL
jgi:hypothetical protein